MNAHMLRHNLSVDTEFVVLSATYIILVTIKVVFGYCTRIYLNNNADYGIHECIGEYTHISQCVPQRENNDRKQKYVLVYI